MRFCSAFYIQFGHLKKEGRFFFLFIGTFFKNSFPKLFWKNAAGAGKIEIALKIGCKPALAGAFTEKHMKNSRAEPERNSY